MEGLFLCVLMILVPTGSAVVIEVTVNPKQSVEGGTVLIGCREEPSDAERIGQLTHLSVEKITQQEILTEQPEYPGVYRKTSVQENVLTRVVTMSWNGEVLWGAGYDSSRASISGNIQKNSSSLTVAINKTRCTDGPIFVCVAQGNRGTVDSPQHSLSFVATPGEMKITGGRNCPLTLHQSRDHCDLYARPGDEIDLVCKARVGKPLDANSLDWTGQNSGLMSSMTMTKNSSSDTCSGEITSALSYKFVPLDSDKDVVITCKVTFKPDFGEFYDSKQVTICREIPETDSKTPLKYFAGERVYTRDHIIGIFFAGFGAMLVILILVILIMCCCGCRLRVKRKRQLEVSSSKQEKF